ncbi:MAG: DUF6468 domain-containing protein [Parvularculaceae bacterium]|nr:hypothetical protein [Parvularculaceae bacterium]
MSAGSILDIVLIALLLAGAVGGFLINRKLARLTSAQEELKAALVHFDDAAGRASAALKQLEAGGLSRSAELQSAARKAETLITELSVMTTAGERIAERIEGAVREVRLIGTDKAARKQKRAA